MRSSSKISIGKMMCLIVPLALELVLFQEVWWIVAVPPVTIVALALNLGLFFVIVRPAGLETRITGMLLGAIAAFFAMTRYLFVGSRVGWASFSRGRSASIGGAIAHDALVSWASSLPDQEGTTALIAHFLLKHMIVIEFVSLDLIGAAMMWAGGWLENRCRSARAQTAARKRTAISVLDDRTFTPS